jgi:hypothetical protein
MPLMEEELTKELTMKFKIITLLLVMGFIGFCKYQTSKDNQSTSCCSYQELYMG